MNFNEKYLEKKIRKYVIATLDIPTLYLKKTPGKNEYIFLKDIEYCTKAVNKNIAEQIKDYYYQDTFTNNNFPIDLVVVPLDISYEIVNESY